MLNKEKGHENIIKVKNFTPQLKTLAKCMYYYYI